MTSPSELSTQLHWRYAVKRFDSSKKIPLETWSALEEALVLSPSSYGLQPWRFVVVTDDKIKEQLPAISWKQTQPRDCSHMVVFAARRTMDEAYVDQFIDSVVAMRGGDASRLGSYRSMILGSVQNWKHDPLGWNARQTYLALGMLLASAAVLGVDACPMEGIQGPDYDRLLGLEGTSYTSIVGCALGYRAGDDPYANAKKVRFPASQVVQPA